MKKFMLLMVGFEMPTPEIMDRWNQWFASIADRTVDMGGLMSGREISRDGTKELTMDREAITGYAVITAENLDEATAVAKENPYISSIRVYEIRSKS